MQSRCLWRWRKGGKGQGVQGSALEAGKGKEMDSAPEPAEKNLACGHIDLSAVRSSDFYNLENTKTVNFYC